MSRPALTQQTVRGAAGALVAFALAMLVAATALALAGRRAESAVVETRSLLLDARAAGARTQGCLEAAAADATPPRPDQAPGEAVERLVSSAFVRSVAPHRSELRDELIALSGARDAAAGADSRQALAAVRALNARIEKVTRLFERLAAEQAAHLGNLRWLLAAVALLTALLQAWLARNARGQAATGREALEVSLHLMEDYERRIHAIALELHDDIAQKLYALLPRLGPGDNAASQAVHEALDRVKALSHELRPDPLLGGSLSESIERLCRRFAASGAPTVSFGSAGTEHLDVPREATTQIHRVVQEALTNAARHAHARAVSVTLAVSYPNLIVRVMDDGVGLPDDARPDATHLGLRGMNERVRLLQGQLLVGSRPGRGTTVTAVIPITEFWNEQAHGGARR